MSGIAVVLLQAEIDPSVVRPGWTPLLVTTLLMVALVFLFLSLRKQLRKIDVPGDHVPDAADGAPADRAREDPEQGAAAKTSPPESR